MKTFLVGITTYSSPAYIDLSLYYMTRYRQCDVIVLDDCSRDKKLMEVCQKYHVPMLSNRIHYTHYGNGDLNMMATIIEYARENGYQYAVKQSRRWICLQNPFAALEDTICASGGYTFTNVTKTEHFGFRTEFIAFDAKAWYKNVPEMRKAVENDSHGLVEHYVHLLARKTQPPSALYHEYMESHPCGEGEDGYVKLDWMGTDRSHVPAGILWHNTHQPSVYHRKAREVGLDYRKEDFEI